MIPDLPYYIKQHLYTYLSRSDILILSQVCKDLIDSTYKKNVIIEINELIRLKNSYYQKYTPTDIKIQYNIKFTNIDLYLYLYSIDTSSNCKIDNNCNDYWKYNHMNNITLKFIQIAKLNDAKIEKYHIYKSCIQCHDNGNYFEKLEFPSKINCKPFSELIDRYLTEIEKLLKNMVSPPSFYVCDFSCSKKFKIKFRETEEFTLSYGCLTNSMYINILHQVSKLYYFYIYYTIYNRSKVSYNYFFSLHNFKYKNKETKNIIIKYYKRLIPLCTQYKIFINNESDKISEFKSFENISYYYCEDYSDVEIFEKSNTYKFVRNPNYYCRIY